MANKSRSLTTISDPSLDPYFITKDDHCYTVNINMGDNNSMDIVNSYIM